MWMVSSKTPSFQMQYKITGQITQYSNGHDNIELFSSSFFDEIALINNENVLLKNYNFISAEVLAHIAAVSHKNPQKALIVGGYNIEIARELKKHNIKTDIVISDIEILNVMSAFFYNFKDITNDESINIKTSFIELNNRDYDIVIYLGNIMPHEFSALSKLCSNNFILLFKLPDIFLQPQQALASMQIAYPFATVLMPFYYNNVVENQYFAFLSNAFHPIADLRLQASDMLEDLKYYNAKVHEGVFYMPNYIKSLLKNALKI